MMRLVTRSVNANWLFVVAQVVGDPGVKLIEPGRQRREPDVHAVVPLDRVDATSVGRLLAASSTTDVVDAHVVICARRAAQPVVTSDPDDLTVLDPTLSVVVV